MVLKKSSLLQAVQMRYNNQYLELNPKTHWQPKHLPPCYMIVMVLIHDQVVHTSQLSVTTRQHQLYDRLLSPNCTVRELDLLIVEKIYIKHCGIFMSIVFSRQLGSMHFKDNWSHWSLSMPVVPLYPPGWKSCKGHSAVIEDCEC